MPRLWLRCAAMQKPHTIDTETRTHSGTRLVGGHITPNDRRRLTGRRAALRADEMTLNTTVMRQSALISGTLESARLALACGDEATDLGRVVRAAVEEAFGLGPFEGRGKMSQSIDAALRPFTRSAWWHGYRYAEKKYRIEPDVKGIDRVWIDLADCEPSAHDRWVSEDGRALDGIIQHRVDWGSGEPEMVPAGKLMLVTIGKSGSNWAGMSTAEAVRWWVEFAGFVAGVTRSSFARSGVGGIMFADLDEAAARDAGVEETDARETQDILFEILKKFNGSADFTAGKITNWLRVTTIGATFSASESIRLDQWATQKILEAWLAAFQTLGEHETGARSIGDVHSTFFVRSMVVIISTIVEEFNTQVLQDFVRLNFGSPGLAVAPHLVHHGLDTELLGKAMPLLANLKQAGLIEAYPELAAAMMRVAGAPEDTRTLEQKAADRAARNTQTEPQNAQP